MSQIKPAPPVAVVASDTTLPSNPEPIKGHWAVVSGRAKNEAAHWQRIFKGPAWAALLLVASLLLVLAWQVPFGYTLDAANELHLDQPFMRNFNAIEETKAAGQPEKIFFRWSKNEGSWDFAGIGRQAYRVHLTVEPGINPDPHYTLLANGQPLAQGLLEPNMATYSFDVPAALVSNSDGNLRLTLQVPSFTPPGDPRSLGFVFYSLKLEGKPTGPVIPPLSQLGWLLGVIGLSYMLMGRAGFKNWTAAGAAGGLALMIAGIVAAPGARAWLTIYSQTLALAFGWALVLTILAGIPLHKVWQSGMERAWVLSIFGLALALRLAGVLHPHTSNSVGIIDLGFHINHYGDLWDRGQWWVKIESGEWGNRLTYYPLTSYLLLGLFQWLTPDRRLLILLLMVTLESSRILLVFYLVKRATGQGRAGIIAAFLMAALPVNNLSLTWGQSANLIGEWFILAALCLVVVKWEQLHYPLYFILLTGTLLVSFITHPGVVLLSGLAFLAYGLLAWFDKKQGRSWRVFAAAYWLAIVLAFAVYHRVTVQEMIPQALESLNSKLKGGGQAGQSALKASAGWRVGGQVADSRLGLPVMNITSLDKLLFEGLKGFGREARVYFEVFPLIMLPWGMWLLQRGWPGYLESSRRLYRASLAWAVVASLFAITGLLLNLYVRYSLFWLPLVAVGAGVFMDWLWRRSESYGRGWVAIGLVSALCGWLATGTLAVFYDRLVYFGHG